MDGRFTKPVLPGQALTVEVWVDGDGGGDGGGAATFRTSADGEVVIDRGCCSYR
jgi:acyl dehydratase